VVLWLSDEDAEQSWSKWCTDEDFDGLGTTSSTFDLVPDHNVLILTSADDLRGFTADFADDRKPFRGHGYIDWHRVADKYQGLLITPYVWSMRLDDSTFWYYGWDCASACVWDVSALTKVNAMSGTLLQIRSGR
jgi:hypothetical protein